MLATVVLLLFTPLIGGQKADDEPAVEVPTRYILDYPVADKFCPPMRTFVEDINSVRRKNGRRTVRFKLNGGYGLKVKLMSNGQNLLHLGSDVGWYRVGDPVFAIANGVVRHSVGADVPGPKGEGALPWGNLIVIEHHLPNGEFFTSVYGHLSKNRKVQRGDLVIAGQEIGSVGRQSKKINGGYKPHLHFGIRQGRLIEPGITLFQARVDGELSDVTLVDFDEERAQISLPASVATKVTRLAGEIPVFQESGKQYIPSNVLWMISSRPGFSIAGYGLDLSLWHHPAQFLQRHGAFSDPAPFFAKRRNEADRKR